MGTGSNDDRKTRKVDPTEALQTTGGYNTLELTPAAELHKDTEGVYKMRKAAQEYDNFYRNKTNK